MRSVVIKSAEDYTAVTLLALRNPADFFAITKARLINIGKVAG
jgi:hypothetical protein